MKTHQFGNSGEMLSRIGLGCFSMSGAYGEPDDEESIATIQKAVEMGVSLLDTSASYGQGHNHRLIGEALKGDLRKQVFLHSKTGTIKTLAGSQAQGSGTPARLRQICEISLKNLGTDYLDCFCMSRIDPTVPVEESVGEMGRLIDEGKTRFISLSEASPQSLRRAHKERELISLQFEYSLWTRDVEEDHFQTCQDLGLALMAYAPLGYGFLTGAIENVGSLSKEDTRQKFPRFSEVNAQSNLQKVKVIEQVAARHGATAAQIAIAWTFDQSDFVFPIPGCKSRRHLEENLDAIHISLTAEDRELLDDVFKPGTVAGDRYPPDGMARVNL